jgi:hypothetical protein
MSHPETSGYLRSMFGLYTPHPNKNDVKSRHDKPDGLNLMSGGFDDYDYLITFTREWMVRKLTTIADTGPKTCNRLCAPSKFRSNSSSPRQIMIPRSVLGFLLQFLHTNEHEAWTPCM